MRRTKKPSLVVCCDALCLRCVRVECGRCNSIVRIQCTTRGTIRCVSASVWRVERWSSFPASLTHDFAKTRAEGLAQTMESLNQCIMQSIVATHLTHCFVSGQHASFSLRFVFCATLSQLRHFIFFFFSFRPFVHRNECARVSAALRASYRSPSAARRVYRTVLRSSMDSQSATSSMVQCGLTPSHARLTRVEAKTVCRPNGDVLRTPCMRVYDR